tara:strand:- start:90 stop:1838 length:1749 start_codon:yes stop_codon:yes gene_type:complete
MLGATDDIRPWNTSTNSGRDAGIDLGAPTGRWKDLYLSGGIQGAAAGSIVINEAGLDVDFRVESDTITHALFVQGSNGFVGIGNSTPSHTLSVAGSTRLGLTSIYTGTGGAVNSNLLYFGSSALPEAAAVYSQTASSTAGDLVFATAQSGTGTMTERLRINSAGAAIFKPVAGGHAYFNENGVDADFRVESDGNANMLFVNAASNLVRVGGAGGSYTLSTFGVESGTNTTACSFESALGGAGAACHVYLGVSTRANNGLQLSSMGSGAAILGGSLAAAIYNTEAAQLSLGGNNVSNQLILSSSEIVINDGSANTDFRVESNTNTHMLFVDAGLERVSIGRDSTNTGVVSLSVTGVTPVSGTNTYYAQRIGSVGFADSGGYTALIGLSVEPNAGWSKGAIGWTRTGGYDTGNIVFLNRSLGDASTAALSDERMRITSSGVVVTGSLSKSSGSFRIPHPIKSETHDLVHSFVEAPQADNIYRGKVTMIAGQASVNIDTIAGMTDGTFAVLNREVQCFTSNETGWTAVRGSVSGNILTIEAQDASCTDTISWMVIGERQDQHMYDTEWTDENGKVIVEPLKPVEE